MNQDAIGINKRKEVDGKIDQSSEERFDAWIEDDANNLGHTLNSPPSPSRHPSPGRRRSNAKTQRPPSTSSSSNCSSIRSSNRSSNRSSVVDWSAEESWSSMGASTTTVVTINNFNGGCRLPHSEMTEPRDFAHDNAPTSRG